MDDIFYLVPITDCNTYINNIRLCDICADKMDMIKNLEKKKKELLDKGRSIKVKRLFLNFYNSIELPEYIIVVQNKIRTRELMTDFDIVVEDYCELQKYRVFEVEEVLHYFIKADYKNKIINLIKNSEFKNDKELIKRINKY